MLYPSRSPFDEHDEPHVRIVSSTFALSGLGLIIGGDILVIASGTGNEIEIIIRAIREMKCKQIRE
jgi:hypothetical protein